MIMSEMQNIIPPAQLHNFVHVQRSSNNWTLAMALHVIVQIRSKYINTAGTIMPNKPCNNIQYITTARLKQADPA